MGLFMGAGLSGGAAKWWKRKWKDRIPGKKANLTPEKK